MFKKIFLTSALLLDMVICFSVPAFSATLIVKPDSPVAYGTIQEAIDAAAPGDTILISALPSSQTYNEAIVVDKSGITLTGNHRASRGKCKVDMRRTNYFTIHDLGELVSPADNWEDCCSPVILDACDDNGCMKTAITIAAPNVTVEKLTIRHANPGIDLTYEADNAVINNNCFFDYKDGVNSNSTDNVAVSDCIFFGGDNNSIFLYGNNATVTNNRFRAVDNGIGIQGINAVVDGNIFLNCNDDAIRLWFADNAKVRNNYIEVADDAIYIFGGDNVLVTNNRSKEADNGIYIDSNQYDYSSIITNPVVTNNWIEGGEEGIRFSPYQDTNSNPTIRNNIVAHRVRVWVN